MGFFKSEKHDKHTLGEAKRILLKDKYKNHTAVPMGDGTYIIVKENNEKLNNHIGELKKDEFRKYITGNGEYENMPMPNTNNKQQATKESYEYNK